MLIVAIVEITCIKLTDTVQHTGSVIFYIGGGLLCVQTLIDIFMVSPPENVSIFSGCLSVCPPR